jgi:nitrite reductase/ring-hydroxylating ferredoxin subunit
MKKYILLLLLPLFWNCDSDNFNNNNPYIPNYTFSIEINTDLPTYNNLKFVGNGVYIANYGARGVIVFNTSGNSYTAFDAACPNQAISSCSTMAINGINAVCSCDSASYSLFSGQSPGKEYPMKPYRVEVNGNLIRVYN